MDMVGKGTNTERRQAFDRVHRERVREGCITSSPFGFCFTNPSGSRNQKKVVVYPTSASLTKNVWIMDYG